VLRLHEFKDDQAKLIDLDVICHSQFNNNRHRRLRFELSTYGAAAYKYIEHRNYTVVSNNVEYLFAFIFGSVAVFKVHCLKKCTNLKRYSSNLPGLILMTFGRNIQNTLE